MLRSRAVAIREPAKRHWHRHNAVSTAIELASSGELADRTFRLHVAMCPATNAVCRAQTARRGLVGAAIDSATVVDSSPQWAVGLHIADPAQVVAVAPAAFGSDAVATIDRTDLRDAFA